MTSTERIRAQESLAGLPLAGTISVHADGTVLDIDGTMKGWIGAEGDELVGSPLSRVLEVRMPLSDQQGQIPTDASLRSLSGARRPVLIAGLPAPEGEHRIVVFDVSVGSPFNQGLQIASALTARGAERLQILLGASVGFAAAHTETQAAELLADVAKRAYRASAASVHLRRDGELTRVAGVNPLEPFWPEGLRDAGERTLSGREVLVARSPEEADGFVPGFRISDAYKAAGIHAALAAPIVYDGAAIGSMICYFDHPRQFDSEAVPLAEALANQAAQAITRMRLEEDLRRAAMHDVLTGLPSRRLFEEEVTRYLTEGAGVLSVMFVDLDGFKAVNDSLGHPVGDQLLAQVGQRLQTIVRRTDVIGRYGGDEFVAVAQVDHAEEALRLAERVREVLAQPFPGIPGELGISASIGVVLVERTPGRSFVADQLIRAADHAMYEAKAAGGNRAVVHQEA